jgi:hypothetical protein
MRVRHVPSHEGVALENRAFDGCARGFLPGVALEGSKRAEFGVREPHAWPFNAIGRETFQPTGTFSVRGSLLPIIWASLGAPSGCDLVNASDD